MFECEIGFGSGVGFGVEIEIEIGIGVGVGSWRQRKGERGKERDTRGSVICINASLRLTRSLRKKAERDR